MNIEQLATLVLDVLDAQQTYFTSRDRADLIASKRLESKLRRAAWDVIEPKPKQETLLDGI
jgi:hypothetical protein